MNITNIIYVFFWGAVSFIASFMFVLDGDWHQLVTSDLLKGILCPFFLWIAAFFADYIFVILGMNKDTQIINPFWIKFSYFIIEAIFLILIACAYWTSVCGRTVCIALLFIFLLGLKTASLYAVSPRQRLVKA
ncbi:MAG: hypothetical protein NC095_04865 [Muribaculum sp.]|nr:hypothetical protein [Muribaculum sp.]